MQSPKHIPALMLQGTGSDVGKTVLVAGLCRLWANRGVRVMPFKPQNMSNNAAVAEDGGEIGRAQWLQALAARVPTSVHMNPILLKPQSQTGSQIVVHGQVVGQAKGRDYQKLKAGLLSKVLESYDHLRTQCDLVIVEGAGSPAEINLRAGDIANMGFATAADVPVVLVGDIDRGGVIASLVGTHTILPPEDREMIRGYLINKFRGDVSLFDDGLTAITEHTFWPSFGVVPYLPDAARLPAEDSVALERLARVSSEALSGGKFRIAVPVLDRIANFDDLDPLRAEPDIDLIFVGRGEPLPDADLVIIPGSKSTIGDLEVFRRHGWDLQLQSHVAQGGAVLGICGGYQMLGQMVTDPHCIEGDVPSAEGLRLLDVKTQLQPEKTVRNTSAAGAGSFAGANIEAYEIHLGVTQGGDAERPFSTVDGRPEGAVSRSGRVMGTYLHGLFTSDDFRRAFLTHFGAKAGQKDFRAEVDDALDSIAARLEELLDIEAMFGKRP
ncbi:MAG: cobyric acid synthase [Pseudomonadota bacterium]